MENKLISMTAFVLQEYAKLNAYYYQENKVLAKIHNYAKFLSLPLTIGMFVACDEDGNVLEEPKQDKDVYTQDMGILQDYDVIEVEEYEEAQSRILFEGFSLDSDEERNFLIYDNGKSSFEYWIVNNTFHIMDGINILTDIDGLSAHNLTLTATAKKIIGL